MCLCMHTVLYLAPDSEVGEESKYQHRQRHEDEPVEGGGEP